MNSRPFAGLYTEMFDSSQTDQSLRATADLKDHLMQLHAERALAVLEGLDRNAAFISDLDDELAAARAAYIGAAVTEIATLRGELSGPQVG
jgi:hypothetical protein